MDFIASMFLLYLTEAIVIAAGGLIFFDDDEEEALVNVAQNVFGTATAGIPLVREAAGAIQGFSGGGVIGGVTKDIASFTTQVGQGELDAAALRSLVKALAAAGVPLPGSQFSKASRAVEEGEGGLALWTTT